MMASASDLCCACNSAQNAKGSSFAVAVAVAVAVVAGDVRRRDDVRRCLELRQSHRRGRRRLRVGGGTTFCVFFTAGAWTRPARAIARAGGAAPPRARSKTRRDRSPRAEVSRAARRWEASPARRRSRRVRARFFRACPSFPAGFGDASLGADMPAMRRSRSSRDMVVAETDWGGARRALAAAPPMPRRPLSASASFAAPGTPTPGTPTPVSGTLPTMAPGIGFLPSARRFPAAAPAPLPRPIAPANPLLPATGIFGPRGGRLRGGGRRARSSGQKRRRHREHAPTAALAVLSVPASLGDLPLLIRHDAIGRRAPELRHRRRVAQVDELRGGEHRARRSGRTP